MDYKEAGVDIEKGDALVARIKKKVKSTYGPRVREGVGGFASLYEMQGGRLLAAGTDGVGTKIKIAQELGIHNTIGIDLVAMCVNDILCTGAKPLFFMDYLATGSLDLSVSEDIIDGIVEGCRQSGAALIGGETAEMPGLYNEGEYDLAGFAVGEVDGKELIDGQNIKEGDTIIGLSSSGFHSNGFSLIRKVFSDKEDLKNSLVPTKIYWKVLERLLFRHKRAIKGIAHVTGGGILNIPRINGKFDYILENWPSFDEINPLFASLQSKGDISNKEMFKTFNMGIGMVLVTSEPTQVATLLNELNEPLWKLGHVRKGYGHIKLEPYNINLSSH